MAQVSQATEAECRGVLYKCSIAVTELQKDNALDKAIIEDQTKLIETQKEQVDQSRAWYHNPAIVFPIALLAGFAGGVYIMRR